MPLTLYLIRHGQADYKLDTLTSLGRSQAEILQERLAPVSFTRVLCSPRGRTVQTAELVLGRSLKANEVVPWLSEVEHDQEVGNSVALDGLGEELQVWGYGRVRIPGGSWVATDANVHTNRWCLFSHTGVIKVLTAELLDLPFTQLASGWWPKPGSVTRLMLYPDNRSSGFRAWELAEYWPGN